MAKRTEATDSAEKQALKTPEKKIDTFDDLQQTGASDRIKTFDDLASKSGSEKFPRTFDDLSDSGKVGSFQESSDRGSRADLPRETPEALEDGRLGQAVAEIKQQEWMQDGKWRTLSTDEKRIALEHSGRALGRAYRTPEPPLTTKKDASEAQGEFGDGYSYDPRKKCLTGSDYGIRMNEEGITKKDKRLFGDDPGEALRTYGHEFRHSYQTEQAHAFDKNFSVDDPVKAREWSENLKPENYIKPPNSDLAKSDPERYFRKYEAYRNQPVERDAREFGDRLVTQVYSPKSHEEYKG